MDKNLFTIFVVITVLVIGIGIVFFAKNEAFRPIPTVQLDLPKLEGAPAIVELSPPELPTATSSATSSDQGGQ